jgi:hypothetical protein
MSQIRFATLGLVLFAASGLSAQGQNCPATGKGPLPLKYSGGPTVAAITPCDLMNRLYKYADDSMMGRQVGTEYHHKAVAYIESEVRRMGLKPGGDNGGYYQDFPITERKTDPSSTLTVGSETFRLGPDFLAAGGGTLKQFADAGVVFAGVVSDTMTRLDSAAVAGKVLLIMPAAGMKPEAQRAMIQSESYKAYTRARQGALAVVNILTDSLYPRFVGILGRPSLSLGEPSAASTGMARFPTVYVSMRVATAMLGGSPTSMTKGQAGRSFSSDVKLIQRLAPAGRNVVAILPGSDPKLKDEYIAIGGHSDHVGFGQGSQGESDSLKVWGAVGHPAGAEGGRSTPLSAEEWAKVNSDIAEMRKIYPARPDSISNGADDDGTGSVSVLEIAEAFAKSSVKPKRSILFVWHAGEEMGMWGSGYFMDHPTVPRDSIVAQLNIDMVGRGAASDVTGQAKDGGILHGGDRYVQLVGSRRLSTELGDLVETVNKEKNHGFNFDYNIDANGHPQNIYCRSDHWSYGKWGVPVVFFTTGGHADYHQVTDEPQFIRYGHMAALDSLIYDIGMKAANLDHRVVVDGAKPNPAPATVCKQ